MKETKHYYIKVPLSLPQSELNAIREEYKPNYVFSFRSDQKEIEVEEITEEEFLSYISED
jgi:hypothetical protein